DKQRLGIVSPEIMKKELKNVMLKLFDFQEKAVLEIVEKYEKHLGNPAYLIIKNKEGEVKDEIPVPFIQILDALTGSGKTVILAKTVGEIRKSEVIMLSEYQERLLEENETLVLFATVGTFNQKDKEAGNRQIYQ
ncbi:17311_t:CDS:2, partial [Cetraspora pellucida]